MPVSNIADDPITIAAFEEPIDPSSFPVRLSSISEPLILESPSAATVAQRIYDTGLAQYVTYTSSVTTTPDSAITIPNHTNNLVTATHEVL